MWIVRIIYNIKTENIFNEKKRNYKCLKIVKYFTLLIIVPCKFSFTYYDTHLSTHGQGSCYIEIIKFKFQTLVYCNNINCK